MVLGIATSVVIARTLGPEGKGAYAVVVQSVSILIALGQFGLPEVMLYQMRAERRQPEALAGNSVVILLMASLLIAIGLWVTYPLLTSTVYREIPSRLLWLAFWMVPFNLGFLFYSRLIQLDGRVRAYNGLSLLQASTWLVALLIWLWIWPGRTEAAVLGLVTSQAFAALGSAFLARRWVARGKWRWNRSLMSESLQGGMKVQVGMAAALLGQRLGIFVLNTFLDLRSVGWFSTALGLTNFLLLFSTSTRTVLQAWMSSTGTSLILGAQHTIMVAKHTGLMLFVGAIVLAISGRTVIHFIYGEAFVPAYKPTLFLLVGVVSRGIAQVIASYLNYEKRLGIPSIAAGLAVVVNAILALLLVPSIGMYGAALATSIGQLVSLLFLVRYFVSLTGCVWTEFWPSWRDICLYRRWATYLLQRYRLQ
jgi:O-antigen/teichoic acid export membrane protein